VNVAERVQASIRAVNAAERDAVVAGAFTLYRSPASDHPYLNYAVPNAEAGGWDRIDALREAFAAHGLRPRLEFVAECAPGLEEALAADGFELQGRYPVMTLPAEALREVPAPDGVVIARILAGGEPAGAAFRSAVAEGVSELGGIGVRERFRRRGIAAALTAAAAADAVADGAQLCFLTPGDGGAERVYARAGFARAGTTVVHMVG